MVGIKSSPNIGLPDRRGRELINCRNERGMGDREACGSQGDRKTGNRQRMLKLVNRTNNKSRSGRFTFCADLRDVASRIPFCLSYGFLSLSLFFLRSSSPRRTDRSRLCGSDNGGLALSSWFIASFDCQLHAGESTRPSSSSYVCSMLLLLCFVSDFGRLAPRCMPPLRFPYITVRYSDRVFS